MFKKFFSKVRANDAEEDISTIDENLKPTQSIETIGYNAENYENSGKEGIFNHILSKEIVIVITGYLQLIDLNNFARCDRFLLKLFFNLTPRKVIAISKRKEELASQNIETRIVSMKGEYKDDELSTDIQLFIWKPLVLYHFPQYSTILNVKNWMHVLRRRIIHLKNRFPNELPLSTIIPSATTKNGTTRMNKDRQFIENCEWEYECPLKSYILNPTVEENVRFCSVCKENVYEVITIEEFRYHVEKDHCVAFSQYLEKSDRPQKIGKIRNPNYYKAPPKIKKK